MGKSNLGDYQRITTISKKVGGPRKLCLIILATGGIIGVVGGSSYEKLKQRLAKNLQRQGINEEHIFNVYSDGECDGGLKFKKGDKFKVLSSDGDAILIEKIGDSDNPYFASADFLSTLSNFKA